MTGVTVYDRDQFYGHKDMTEISSMATLWTHSRRKPITTALKQFVRINIKLTPGIKVHC